MPTSKELAEQVMNQVATGAWLYCSREWNIQNCASVIDADRADLAAKVLEAIDVNPRLSLVTKSEVSAALRELFRVEGVGLGVVEGE